MAIGPATGTSPVSSTQTPAVQNPSNSTSDFNESIETTKQQAAKGDQVAKRKLAKLKPTSSPGTPQVNSNSTPSVQTSSTTPSNGGPAAATQGKGIGVNTVA